MHTTRRSVIVVSDQNQIHGTNSWSSNVWPSVLIVPISTQERLKTAFDVEIPYGEGNLGTRGWARIPALQLIDKDYLEDMSGQIRLEKLEEITARILDYLGILLPVEETSTSVDNSEFDNMSF